MKVTSILVFGVCVCVCDKNFKDLLSEQLSNIQYSGVT